MLPPSPPWTWIVDDVLSIVGTGSSDVSEDVLGSGLELDSTGIVMVIEVAALSAEGGLKFDESLCLSKTRVVTWLGANSISISSNARKAVLIKVSAKQVLDFSSRAYFA